MLGLTCGLGAAGWGPDPLTLAALLGTGSLYAAGVLRLRRRSVAWPASRSAWFALGLLTLAVALVSPVEGCAELWLSWHMAQHLLITLVGPPLLALGTPIRLAMRATSTQTARTISIALRSRPATFLLHPITGWLLFVGASYAVHLTGVYDAALRSAGWHAAEHLVWVSSALVYWWPIVGRDPMPHPVPYPARMFSLLLAMPAMSFLSLSIYVAGQPLYPGYASLPAPWGPAAAHDQRVAAAMMWLVTGLVSIVAMLLIAVDWRRHDQSRQARAEARDDARGPVASVLGPGAGPTERSGPTS